MFTPVARSARNSPYLWKYADVRRKSSKFNIGNCVCTAVFALVTRFCLLSRISTGTKRKHLQVFRPRRVKCTNLFVKSSQHGSESLQLQSRNSLALANRSALIVCVFSHFNIPLKESELGTYQPPRPSRWCCAKSRLPCPEVEWFVSLRCFHRSWSTLRLPLYCPGNTYWEKKLWSPLWI